jgi:hypothetical protein
MAFPAAIPADDLNPAKAARNILVLRHLTGRLAGMRTYRYSWWVHWRELADYLLPRRYKWLITPNQWSRGSPINQHIIDSTGTIAARTLAAGIMSGVSSPTRPWFRLKLGRIDSTQTSPVSLWLAECERIIYLILKESNFYNALAVAYYDLVIFGTCAVLIYEDFDNVINCLNPCLGEYFIDNNDKMQVDSLYREFTLTVKQVVDQFGIENCCPSTQTLYRTGGGMLQRELIVAHAIEPNQPFGESGYVVPRRFRFREVFWEQGQAETYMLSARPYHEFPGAVARWDLVSNDPYGRGTGMDALPDVKQLQQETKRKAQAIDKMVNPPMIADAILKNQPASLIPGGITFIPGMSTAAKPHMAPVYQVVPQIKEMSEDIKEVQERIKLIFYNNLFQMISQFEPKSNISATEIDARRSEQMVLLGPVLDRIDNELLRNSLARIWGIVSRIPGILPPAPEEILNAPIEIEYLSMLSEALASNKGGSIERLFAQVGNLMTIDPAAGDNVDIDFGLDALASAWGVDPRVIRSPEALKAIRKQRAAQQQAEQQQQQMLAATQGAKNLATSPMGPGRNALQSLAGAPT